MRIVIAAVGRLKQGPERELAERYGKRAAQAGRAVGLQPIDIVEIRESRARDAGRRMIEESIAIANVIPAHAVSVILDERGETLSSATFAGRLQGWQAQDMPTRAYSSSAAMMGWLQACAKMRPSPSRSAPRPGRTNSFA